MPNQEQKQNADLIAAQHKYAREKEKADKVLKRYDMLMKVVLAFVGTLVGFPALLMLAFGVIVPAIITLIIGGGVMILLFIVIKKRKEAHQTKLDSQIMDNIQE